MLFVLFATLFQERMSGVVVDDSGAPVVGARVMLGEFGHATLYYTTPEEMFPGTPGVPEGEASRYAALLTSDANGRFEASGLVAGEYSIVASAPRHGLAITSVWLREGAALDVRVPLQPPGFLVGRVSGRVFDPSVNVLELKPRASNTNIVFVPKLVPQDGAWSFRSVGFPALREWTLVGSEVALAHDYRATLFSVPVDAAAGEETKVEIALDGGSSITGRVLDSDGAVVSGVSVVAVSKGLPTREFGAISDAEGRFRIGGLSTGTWRLDAGRWLMRETPGCGNGRQELFGSHHALVTGPTHEYDVRVSASRAAPAIGVPAPDFESTLIDGRTFKLSSQRGKLVLIDFWATWCSMCRADFPLLLETYERFAADGRFEIVSVSLDEDPALVRRFVASRKLRWVQTALGPPRTNPIAQLYNVHATPSTVLIAPDGSVLALDLTGDELRRRIEELLSAK